MTSSPAPLRRRLLALLIDYALIVLYIGGLLAVAVLGYNAVLGHIPNLIALYGPSGAHAIGFAVLTLPVMLYFIMTETSAGNASVGKRAMHLQVRAAQGRRATRGQIITRTIIKFLPWELAHTAVYQLIAATQQNQPTPLVTILLLTAANVLPIIYIATIVIRRDHRGPHDLAAGTQVVQ